MACPTVNISLLGPHPASLVASRISIIFNAIAGVELKKKHVSVLEDFKSGWVDCTPDSFT
jgi:hypothetical protein